MKQNSYKCQKIITKTFSNSLFTVTQFLRLPTHAPTTLAPHSDPQREKVTRKQQSKEAQTELYTQ